MNTVRRILELILITLIFYALYNLSLLLHTHFFKEEDPALFVFVSFLLSFLLILFYRFAISHGVKRRVQNEVQELYRKKEEKMKVLAEASSSKETASQEHNQTGEKLDSYGDKEKTKE